VGEVALRPGAESGSQANPGAGIDSGNPADSAAQADCGNLANSAYPAGPDGFDKSEDQAYPGQTLKQQ
jgi:hypothetical protein